MGLLPKPKHNREQKMRAFKKALRKHRNPRSETYHHSIDKILANFCLKYDMTERHLRESYIRILLLSDEIDEKTFKGSILITKKFLTRIRNAKKNA